MFHTFPHPSTSFQISTCRESRKPKALVAAGAHVGAADHADAVAPLFLALSKGHAECAARLLDARAAADEVEPLRGQTAQHAAAAAEPAVAPALLERLLVDGGALHADREGFTALHVAAGRGCVAALQLLRRVRSVRRAAIN